MKKIIWAPDALEQMNDIVDYIAIDSESRAEEWAISIIDAVERLAEFLESGRIVKDVDNPSIKEIVKGNYRIVYQIQKTKIEILVVKNVRQSSTFE